MGKKHIRTVYFDNGTEIAIVPVAAEENSEEELGRSAADKVTFRRQSANGIVFGENRTNNCQMSRIRQMIPMSLFHILNDVEQNICNICFF